VPTGEQAGHDLAPNLRLTNDDIADFVVQASG
jgi:hypothetical protein